MLQLLCRSMLHMPELKLAYIFALSSILYQAAKLRAGVTGV